MKIFKFLIPISVLCVLISCNKSSVIGNELLENTALPVIFTDTIAFTVENVKIDSTLLLELTGNSDGAILNSFLVGKLDDPIFGKTESQAYAEFSLSASDFEGATLDSIILSLEYDSTGFYGDTLLEQTIEIYRLTEDLGLDLAYFSDRTFQTESTPLATYSFMAKPTTFIEVIDTSGTNPDTSSLTPHIRVPLNNALGEEILSLDTMITQNDSLFKDVFKGLNIRSVGSENTMMSFNLDGQRTFITIHYTVDGNARETNLRLNFNGFRTAKFEHNYEGAFVNDYLDDSVQAEQYMFVQSMAGINLEIGWNDLTWLDGAVISKAELEFTVAGELENNDQELYPPIGRIFGHERGSDNQFVVSSDVFTAIANTSFNIFGGNVKENPSDTTLQIYTFNVTQQLQEALTDQLSENPENGKFILSSFVEPETRLPNSIPLSTKAEIASRTVFYGPKNSSFPAKLNVTYIKP